MAEIAKIWTRRSCIFSPPGGVSRGMPTQVRRAILFEQNVLNYLCQIFKIFFTERQYARALQSSAISYTATCGNSSAVVSLPFSHLVQARTRARLSVQLYFPRASLSRWRRKGDWSCWLLCVRSSCRDRVCLAQFRYSFNPCLQHH